MKLVDEAEGLLLHQFSKASILRVFIRSLVKPFAETYDVLEKLHHGRYVMTPKAQRSM